MFFVFPSTPVLTVSKDVVFIHTILIVFILQNAHNRHSMANYCIFYIKHLTGDRKGKHLPTLGVRYVHFTTQTLISWMQLGAPLNLMVSETADEAGLLQLAEKWREGTLAMWMGYPTRICLKLKSRECSFERNVFLSCPIMLKRSTEHNNNMLCVKWKKRFDD